MRKVAIVTIISHNYGNRLQNFALQETLKFMGMKVKTVAFKKENLLIKDLKSRIKAMLVFLKPVYRKVCWDRFDRNISFTRQTVADKRLIGKFDYFVAGSDQIWNPMFSFNSDREYLTFAPSDKRVAYSASFGVNELDENIQADCAKKLEGFKAISVREHSAAKLVNKLCGKDAPVVLDPSMLITKERWEKLSKKSKLKMKEPYVFKYILGIRNEAYDKMIDIYAKSIGAKVVDITLPDKEMQYAIGPYEFLYFLAHSEMVFTDSFHASAFSILFHKQFYVFERPVEDGYGEMSSRLDTLFSTFELGERRIFKQKEL